MPLDKADLTLSGSRRRFNSPAGLLRANPDKAFTVEEIDARRRFPMTRVGVSLYLETVKTVSLVPKIGYTRSADKEYYYWKDPAESGPEEQSQHIPIEDDEE